MDRKNPEVAEAVGDKNIAAVEVEEAVAAAAVGAVLKKGNDNLISNSLDCNFDHNVVGVGEDFDLVGVEEERIVVGMTHTRPFFFSLIHFITVSKSEINQ